MNAFEELDALLDACAARAYFNTYYASEAGRVRAFRLRARAYLTGRRVAVRHVEPTAPSEAT